MMITNLLLLLLFLGHPPAVHMALHSLEEQLGADDYADYKRLEWSVDTALANTANVIYTATSFLEQFGCHQLDGKLSAQEYVAPLEDPHSVILPADKVQPSTEEARNIVFRKRGLPYAKVVERLVEALDAEGRLIDASYSQVRAKILRVIVAKETHFAALAQRLLIPCERIHQLVEEFTRISSRSGGGSDGKKSKMSGPSSLCSMLSPRNYGNYQTLKAFIDSTAELFDAAEALLKLHRNQKNPSPRVFPGGGDGLDLMFTELALPDKETRAATLANGMSQEVAARLLLKRLASNQATIAGFLPMMRRRSSPVAPLPPSQPFNPQTEKELKAALCQQFKEAMALANDIGAGQYFGPLATRSEVQLEEITRLIVELRDAFGLGDKFIKSSAASAASKTGDE